MLSAIATISCASAVPKPCTEKEIWDTSNYVIEGYVKQVVESEPYDVGWCTEEDWYEYWNIRKMDPEGKWEPRLEADVTATITVTKNIKGNYDVGDTVTISYTKVVQVGRCFFVGGCPKYDSYNFQVGTYIRFFDTSCCWGDIPIFEIINPDNPSPTPPLTLTSTQIIFGVAVIIAIAFWLSRKQFKR